MYSFMISQHRTAVSGRKAQIAFYGSDICFEMILDIARDIGAGMLMLLDTAVCA